MKKVNIFFLALFVFTVVCSAAQALEEKVYVVKDKDTLGELTFAWRKQGIEVSRIHEWNPGLGTQLEVGQKILYYLPEDVNKLIVKNINALGQLKADIESIKEKTDNPKPVKVDVVGIKKLQEIEEKIDGMKERNNKNKQFLLVFTAIILTIFLFTCFKFVPSILGKVKKLFNAKKIADVTIIKKIKEKDGYSILLQIDGVLYTYIPEISGDGKFMSLSISEETGQIRKYDNIKGLCNSLKLSFRLEKDKLQKQETEAGRLKLFTQPQAKVEIQT